MHSSHGLNQPEKEKKKEEKRRGKKDLISSSFYGLYVSFMYHVRISRREYFLSSAVFIHQRMDESYAYIFFC